MFKWRSHISVLVIRPRSRWRENLSFCVVFFPRSPLDPPALLHKGVNLLAPHSNWCWDAMVTEAALTDRSLYSTNLICIWDCHTSTLVSNLSQHTRHSLCWLDTAHRRSLLEWLWACKPWISVLPPPLPALGVRYPEAVSRSQKPDVL